MIVQARIEDLMDLAEIADEFYQSSQAIRSFSMPQFIELWATLIDADTGVIFVARRDGKTVGMIGGVRHPKAYDTDTLVAQEFFWFTTSKSRGDGVRLYQAFEKWAIDRGCAEICMGHLVDSMPEKVAKFYERSGYVKTEVSYTKQLQGAA